MDSFRIFQSASSFFQSLFENIGIFELEKPSPGKRRKRPRDSSVIDLEMESTTEQKRHKSAPAAQPLPRSSLYSTPVRRPIPGSNASFTVLQQVDSSGNLISVPLETVTFQDLYISPTHLRSKLTRSGKLSKRDLKDDYGRYEKPEEDHAPETRQRSSSASGKPFAVPDPVSLSPPRESGRNRSRQPADGTITSLETGHRFTSFRQVFDFVEKSREASLTSPLITTPSHVQSRVKRPSSSRLEATSSSSAASPVVAQPSSARPGSPEFEYFDHSELNRGRRPVWMSKSEYTEIEEKFKFAQANAERLRVLAQKERQDMQKAYEEYRNPPVTVARKPVPWPNDQDWEANEKRVRYGNGEENLVFQEGGEQISRRDLQFLLDTEWLNDVCINAFVHLMRVRAKNAMASEDAPAWPKCYFFSSFLLDRLCNGKDGYNYDAVRRVTTRAKVDIFAMDKVLIPFHLGNHWCMACINFSQKRFEYYDSLGGSNATCIKALKRYLDDEHKNKKGSEGFDTSSWTVFVPKNIPHQANGYDCGVFALTYANYLSRGLPFDFSQADMPAIRAKMLIQILQNNPLPLTNE